MLVAKVLDVYDEADMIVGAAGVDLTFWPPLAVSVAATPARLRIFP